MLLVFILSILTCSTSVWAKDQAEPKVNRLHFLFHTTRDDKDKGEAIKVSVFDGTTCVYRSAFIHDTLTFHDWDTNDWATNNGKPEIGWTPRTLGECKKLKFKIEKQGGKGWCATFEILGNIDGQKNEIGIMQKTTEVLFGSRVGVNLKDNGIGLDFEHGWAAYVFKFDGGRDHKPIEH